MGERINRAQATPARAAQSLSNAAADLFTVCCTIDSFARSPRAVEVPADVANQMLVAIGDMFTEKRAVQCRRSAAEDRTAPAYSLFFQSVTEKFEQFGVLF